MPPRPTPPHLTPPRLTPLRLTPLRLLAGFVFEVASTAVVIGVPGAWVLRHMDLAPLAASLASTRLGRSVTVGSLRVGFGETLAIELSDVAIANIAGATAPVMASLRHLSARLDTRSVLRGPVLIHTAALEGLHIRLERANDRTPNWRFGPPHSPTPAPNSTTDTAPLSGFPSLRTVTVKDSALTYRTSSGKDLVGRFDSAALTTTTDDQPVTLSMVGAYNGTPLNLDADLQSLLALRATPKPYGATLRFASGDDRLTFDGTMTTPLDLDGAAGTLDLAAPDPAPLYAIAGVSGGPDASLYLTGAFVHDGPLWKLSNAPGSLQTTEVLKATLALHEAVHGQPDQVELDLALDALNLNDIIGSGDRGKRSGADMPLAVEKNPSTLVTARVTAKALDYASFAASNVALDAAIQPASIKVADFTLTTVGARVRATGTIEPAGAGGRIVANIQAFGADVQALRRELGFGSIPLAGRLDMQFAVDATAPTLNAAAARAQISAVASMRGGSVEKSIVQMVSTDIRALFGTSRGMTPVSCLLVGLEMRAGVSTVAPLRLRAAEGTIAGSATFDLNRRTFDLTIGSDARTTGLFALDIPVRVFGPFATPVVSPAQWTPKGRAQLAAADDISRLPPSLQAFARRNPCLR